MGLSDCESVPTRVLSQGQKRRAALSRLLLVDTPLWILDEPFNALDAAAVDLIRTVLAEHLERGGMVVLASHQDVALGASTVKRLELG